MSTRRDIFKTPTLEFVEYFTMSQVRERGGRPAGSKHWFQNDAQNDADIPPVSEDNDGAGTKLAPGCRRSARSVGNAERLAAKTLVQGLAGEDTSADCLEDGDNGDASNASDHSDDFAQNRLRDGMNGESAFATIMTFRL